MPPTRRSFLAQTAATALAATLPAIAAPTKSTKKGLAGIAPAASGLATNWYYSWRLHPATAGMPAATPSMPFYPMCWGWKPAHAEAPDRQKPGLDSDGSTPEGIESLRSMHPPLLFGFNEPDQAEQSNLAVEQAVDAWPQLTGIAHELVSPSCAKPNGDWMPKFVPEIERRKLQLDSLGYHTYPGPSVDFFVEKLEQFHKSFQRPVWITEFAVADWTAKGGQLNRFTVDQVADFMKGACAFLDKTPWVRGYAWFPTGGKFVVPGQRKGPLASSMLFNADGTLNDLGKLYQSI